VRGHQSKVAADARLKVKEEKLEEDGSAVSEADREGENRPTGEAQAAANREQDPPA
jgi:hypothetical protein